MGRPTDEWFYQQRIEGLIPHVDEMLDRINSAREVAERCNELCSQASSRDEIRQRQELRDLCKVYQLVRDDAGQKIAALRHSVDMIRSDILRSRSMTALREMSDELKMTDLPERADAFLEEFERRLIRSSQANRVRTTRRVQAIVKSMPTPQLTQPRDSPQAGAQRVSGVRPTQEQVHAVPRRLTPEEVAERQNARSPGVLVESALSVVSTPNVRSAGRPRTPPPRQTAPAAVPRTTTPVSKPKTTAANDGDTVNRFAMLDIDWDEESTDELKRDE